MERVKSMEVQRYITNLAYPCSREYLASHARMNGANEDLVQALQGLPYDFFVSSHDVREALEE